MKKRRGKQTISKGQSNIAILHVGQIGPKEERGKTMPEEIRATGELEHRGGCHHHRYSVRHNLVGRVVAGVNVLLIQTGNRVRQSVAAKGGRLSFNNNNNKAKLQETLTKCGHQHCQSQYRRMSKPRASWSGPQDLPDPSPSGRGNQCTF